MEEITHEKREIDDKLQQVPPLTKSYPHGLVWSCDHMHTNCSDVFSPPSSPSLPSLLHFICRMKWGWMNWKRIWWRVNNSPETWYTLFGTSFQSAGGAPLVWGHTLHMWRKFGLETRGIPTLTNRPYVNDINLQLSMCPLAVFCYTSGKRTVCSTVIEERRTAA